MCKLGFYGRLSLSLHTSLVLQSQLALVVAEVVSPKEEGELRVVLLLLHCHLFKLWPVPSDKLGQLVNDIPQFLICTRKKEAAKKDKSSSSWDKRKHPKRSR